MYCLQRASRTVHTPVDSSDGNLLASSAHEALRGDGYEYVGGLEVEFYITRLDDPMLKPEQSGWPPDPPQVSVLAHGFQYLTEHRQDEIDSILQILQENLQGLNLPLRTIEDEWGPGQCEITFDPRIGVEAPATSAKGPRNTAVR